ncbi:hypothetical protein [Neisseria sicca]|nr:hypothetical protein [Neisseria sicca]
MAGKPNRTAAVMPIHTKAAMTANKRSVLIQRNYSGLTLNQYGVASP